MSTPDRPVTPGERRDRLARRHGLHPDHRCADPLEAARAVVALHATEPASVHLAVRARTGVAGPGEVDRVLEEDRTVVKQLAMRRTLFAFPRELLPASWGSATARVAATIGPKLVRDLEAQGVAEDGEAWLAAARAAVVAALAGGPLTAAELRAAVPLLEARLDGAPGKAYGGTSPVGNRVLTQLGAEVLVLRGTNSGHWRTSRPRWTLAAEWLGEEPVPLGPEEGYAALVAAWLRAFGPGTADDLQWWLGATKGAVTAALRAVGAVAVPLEGSSDDRGSGLVLPDDPLLDAPEPEVGPWAALLPVLDPTVMGWKERGFLLGPHGDLLFDRNGNAGTTALWCGRAVGCWVQAPDGEVRVHLLEDVGAEARAALDAEAERLTAWLGGEVVGAVYPSPAMKQAREAIGS